MVNNSFIDSRLSEALVWQVYHRQGVKFAEIPDRMIRISQGGGEKMFNDRLATVLRYCEVRQIMREG